MCTRLHLSPKTAKDVEYYWTMPSAAEFADIN